MPRASVQNVFHGRARHVVQVGSVTENIVLTAGHTPPWRAVRWLAVAVLLSVAAGLLGWAVMDNALPKARTGLSVGAMCCMAGVVAAARNGARAWRRYRLHDRELRLSAAADALADATRLAWAAEEGRRSLSDPRPLPVRWRRADPALHDPWPLIRGDDCTQPIALDGEFAQIEEIFRRVPSGRLVVLGGAGAGKTVLALRFLLDHLDGRRRHNPDAPVAVLLSLSSWDPGRDTFVAWAADRLAADHPHLAEPGADGIGAATELLRSGRLLLVLDGFDELPAATRPMALTALSEMPGRVTGGLLLTSRREEYEAAVEEAGPLAAAAAVELQPLDIEDLARYPADDSPGPHGL
ncbi:NACHT domain-containing protein [Streptomyces sp. NPDC001339]|uniref:NACHT domain-containing protein n=1 Tax=Streptomyces sp. NPDC001339 TaxID=3364563 RepID=UPI0036B5FCC6